MAQDLIDAQFDRAVEIVQGLPTNGPVQTGYEEKLAMYSLYKQATAGNVTTPRPSMFDMLGRAKWDAWAKQKDLSAREAKWQYVETLMRVLRKYSDRTMAKDLLEELESYGDPSNVVMSGSLSRTDTGSESSDSENAEDPRTTHRGGYIDERDATHEPPTTDSETDEDHEQPLPQPSAFEPRRPGSGMSSQNRYRTPAAGSINVPIPSHVFSPVGTPGMQPLPEHSTPSAYAPGGTPIPPPSPHPVTLVQQFSGSQRSTSPRQPASNNNHPYGPYRGTPSFQRAFGSIPSAQQQPSPAIRPSLERAVESMQASLAALHERLEGLENHLGNSIAGGAGASRPSLHSHRISSPTNRGAPTPWPVWNPDDMGAWSLILKPLSRLDNNVKAFAHFIAHSDERSPILVIIRRLFLDLSFLITFLLIAKSIWRRTRLRRREVSTALILVWRALTGTGPARIMDERGV